MKINFMCNMMMSTSNARPHVSCRAAAKTRWCGCEQCEQCELCKNFLIHLVPRDDLDEQFFVPPVRNRVQLVHITPISLGLSW